MDKKRKFSKKALRDFELIDAAIKLLKYKFHVLIVGGGRLEN